MRWFLRGRLGLLGLGALVLVGTLPACEGKRSADTARRFLEEAALPLQGDLAGRIAAADPPHVILISLDTLRADHLGSYGYGVETSPFLDELASFGVRFEQVISQSPKTAPSHMSLFTGVYPYAHGAHYLYEEDQEASVVPVSPELGMLPEWFREMGYRTAAWAGGGQLGDDAGFNRGFDEFHENLGSVDHQKMLAIMDWFRDNSNRPCFLFLHTYQIHDPYVPPAPYNTMFYPDYQGWVVGDREKLRAMAGAKDFFSLQQAFWRMETNKEEDLNLAQFGADDLRKLVALYDGGIRYTDDILRRFFDGLAWEGLLDNTLIAITSDHGEEFMEHGGLLHRVLYRETLHVPLILVHPDLLAGGVVVQNQVEMFDLAPTLLELIGGAVPSQMQAESLLPLLQQEGGAGADRLAFSEEPWVHDVYHRSLRAESYTVYEKGEVTELFSRQDVLEAQDLAAERQTELKRLRAELRGFLAAMEAQLGRHEGESEGISEERIKELEALGYVQ